MEFTGLFLYRPRQQWALSPVPGTVIHLSVMRQARGMAALLIWQT
jgi:hypothetical protein